MELEKSVRMMERNVMAMEAGNHETDDSDAKQKYEGQKQLNTQLLEQKRWLEHELEEIKLKIQNDKVIKNVHVGLRIAQRAILRKCIIFLVRVENTTSVQTEKNTG